MDVSVIIVNYRTVDLTVQALKSIFDMTKGVSFEVIVVDNNSGDGSVEVFMSTFGSKLTLISLKHNIGFGRANNEALKKAKGRNVLFLNPDVKLMTNAIFILSSYLDENPNVGICGGNLYNETFAPTVSYEMAFPSFLYELNYLLLGCPFKIVYGKSFTHNFSDRPKKVSYISGADLMIKRKVMEEVGPFDPRFFMYYEETELCFRVRKVGYSIVSVPSAKIQHFEGRSFHGEKLSKKLKLANVSRTIFYDLCYSTGHKRFANFLRACNINLRVFLHSRFRPHLRCYWKSMKEASMAGMKDSVS